MDSDLPPYDIGRYGYGWLHDKVATPLGLCKVCDSTLQYHVFGAPLKVCPTCFPEEVARG